MPRQRGLQWRPLVSARTALAILCLAVALAGLWDCLDLALQTPRSGMLVTPAGRVVAVVPGGPAALTGVRAGDTVVARNGAPVAGNPLASWSPLPLAPDGLSVVARGNVRRFVFWTAPPAVEVAGDIVALLATLAMLTSALAYLLSQPRGRSAHPYPLAMLCFALALCAAVDLDSYHIWPSLVLAPALFVGLAALVLAQRALNGAPEPNGARTIAVVGAAAALLALANSFLAWPIVSALLIVALAVLAAATFVDPIAAYYATPSERRRRRIRVTLAATAVGLLPIVLWPGLTGGTALFGLSVSIVPPDLMLSPLWSMVGLIPMAALQTALIRASDARQLDLSTRRGFAYALPLLLCLGLVVALAPGATWPARIVLAVALAAIFPYLQYGLETTLVRPPARRPDYSTAQRVIETLAASASTLHDLAHHAALSLPGPLGVTSVTLLVAGLDCPDNAYRLLDSAGHADCVVNLDVDDDTGIHYGALPLRLDSGSSRIGAIAPAEAAIRLWTPLVAGGIPRGVLALGPRLDDDLDDEADLEGIAAVARVLGLALAMRQAVSTLQDRTTAVSSLMHRLSQAHERERAHLSRELHDVVAQELIALTRQLRRYDNDNPPPNAIWADMLTGAQDALTATRRICNGLRPAILDLGLSPALRDIVADNEDQDGGPELSLTVIGQERRLSTDLEFALFRVAQEGLTNALHHAQARHIRLELEYDDAVCLRIRDDGRGFNVPVRFEEFPGDHLGLIGMRERVAEFGGELRIDSVPGRGTTLQVTVRPAA